MHTVRAKHERGLDVVVHDERHAVTRAQAPRGASALDDIDSRRILETPLHDRRTTLDRQPCGLEFVEKDVQLQEILARASSVSGSSAASAS
jgi:hypothetical protein